MAGVHGRAGLEGVAPVTDNLGDLLDKLANAVQEHATVTDKAIRMLSGQIEEVWADNAALRDELHSTNAALANRIEAAHRNGDEWDAARSLVGAADGDKIVCQSCFGSGKEDGGGRCPACHGWGQTIKGPVSA